MARTLSEFLPLSNAEKRLLAACTKGHECALEPATEIAAEFQALMEDASFRARAIACASGNDRANQFTMSSLTATFIDEFSRFVREFSRNPEERGGAAYAAALLPAFSEKFASETIGWRATFPNDDNSIRGTFIRFLLLGGDDENPLHQSGLRLRGAHITANGSDVALDVSGCTIPYAFSIEGCSLEGAVVLDGATTRPISFTGSALKSLSLRNATVRGGLSLQSGAYCDGTVDISGAVISGSIDFSGSTFRTSSIRTIIADYSEIGGDLSLAAGFSTVGQIFLRGTRVRGQLSLSGGYFRTFPIVPNDIVHERTRLIFVLDFQNLNVGGLFLGPNFPVSTQPAAIFGSVNFVATKAENFVYDPRSAPPLSIITDDGKKADCTVTLDGFQYNHLGLKAGSPLLPSMLKLLAQQPTRHVGLDFRPQPYEQLARVLASLGRDRDARTVAQRKADGLRYQEWCALQDRLKRQQAWQAQKPNSDVSPSANTTSSFVESILRELKSILKSLIAVTLVLPDGVLLLLKWVGFNLFLGAGHRHGPVYATFALLVISFGWIYDQAANTPGAFVPVDRSIIRSDDHRTACGQPNTDLPVHWTRCTPAQAPDLEPFSPYLYSLDLMLQVGPLGQKRSWQPSGDPNLRVAVVFPFGLRLFIDGSLLSLIAGLQSVSAIILYVFIVRMLTLQVRDKY